MTPQDSFRFVFPRVTCFLEVSSDDLNDKTLRDVFKACEENHAVVYWGCWSDDELDMTVWDWRQEANV